MREVTNVIAMKQEGASCADWPAARGVHSYSRKRRDGDCDWGAGVVDRRRRASDGEGRGQAGADDWMPGNSGACNAAVEEVLDGQAMDADDRTSLVRRRLANGCHQSDKLKAVSCTQEDAWVIMDSKFGAGPREVSDSVHEAAPLRQASLGAMGTGDRASLLWASRASGGRPFDRSKVIFGVKDRKG